MNVQGIFAFIGFMLSPRYLNLESYKKGYSTDEGAFGVDKCYASLVDFDYWIGSCDHSLSRLRDQVILMEMISTLSGGYMRPIVAYNPWTDIKDDDESIKLVVDALGTRNFAGVKIYPPMGYFPYGNSILPEYPGGGSHPNLGLLDEKLRVLFDQCRKFGVPVMTHSNESMGRKPSHNVLGGPAGWRAFFGNADNAGTKVSLGHIGGETGGATSAGNWTEDFTEIMKLPTASNLYGDLGYWDGIVNGDKDAIERVKALLERKVSNGETVTDRLMFGTDWFMLAQTGIWSSYAIRIQETLSEAGVSDGDLEKMFHLNATRLFETKS